MIVTQIEEVHTSSGVPVVCSTTYGDAVHHDVELPLIKVLCFLNSQVVHTWWQPVHHIAAKGIGKGLHDKGHGLVVDLHVHATDTCTIGLHRSPCYGLKRNESKVHRHSTGDVDILRHCLVPRHPHCHPVEAERCREVVSPSNAAGCCRSKRSIQKQISARDSCLSSIEDTIHVDVLVHSTTYALSGNLSRSQNDHTSCEKYAHDQAVDLFRVRHILSSCCQT